MLDRASGSTPCPAQGATYDLLSGRPWEHFEWEAPHGWATLSEADLARLQPKVLAAELPVA